MSISPSFFYCSLFQCGWYGAKIAIKNVVDIIICNNAFWEV